MSKLTIIVQAYKKELEAQQVKAAQLQSLAESQRAQAANQELEAVAEEEALRQQQAQMMLNHLRANRVQPTPPLPIRQPITSNCVLTGNQATCISQ